MTPLLVFRRPFKSNKTFLFKIGRGRVPLRTNSQRKKGFSSGRIITMRTSIGFQTARKTPKKALITRTKKLKFND
jgi:hypothetical protein